MNEFREDPPLSESCEDGSRLAGTQSWLRGTVMIQPQLQLGSNL